MGAMMLMITGFLSAQIVCPPNSSNNRIYNNTGFYNTGFNSGYGLASTVDNIYYQFANTVNQGYKSGRLTKSEVWRLENDYENVMREIRWAYSDRRISFHERTMIDMYLRRLERNIAKEWNDSDTRLG